MEAEAAETRYVQFAGLDPVPIRLAAADPPRRCRAHFR